ncbi:glycosyltransferase [Photobacterium carnosum]|uniref:glycosyltransferase family 4 protein n=1 Tax=Photobacterium carnosum TaxID=2023717 RepID=UPI001E30E0F3|nr:glycosyltransferase family 4 protein [Photobacterium carnosum]MCD9542978.1 glycosyltransferase [Photobacterium carnosum]
MLILRVVTKLKVGGVERGLLEEVSIIKKSAEFNYIIFVIEGINKDFFNEFDVVYHTSSKDLITNFNPDKINVLFCNKKIVNIIFLIRELNLLISSLDVIYIISSLWKSNLISIIVRFLKNKKIKLISFFHSSSYAHYIDRVISKFAFFVSDKCIYDSFSTKVIYEKTDVTVTDIIPFVFKDDLYFDGNLKSSNPYSFVFIGRLHSVKNISHAINIIYEIKSRGLNPKFDIYGPDEGEFSFLLELVNRLDLSKNVSFKGVLDSADFNKILLDYDFLLQTSLREGMASSVIEGMQRGLIPVVTPVGQIVNYCESGQNSIIIGDDINEVVKDIVRLYKDNRLNEVKFNAMKTVTDMPCFNDRYSNFLSLL